jgi:signal transduction histidine kinase
MDSELSLIKISRILMIYWIASWIVAPLYCVLMLGDTYIFSAMQVATLIGVHAFALGLLYWTGAQQRLGKWFLPLIIALGSFPFFLERSWLLALVNAPDSPPFAMMRAFEVRVDFILLALLIAWQYRFPRALGYTLLITGIDWGLTILITRHIESPTASLLPMLSGRAAMLALTSYVVAWLRQRQLQQQAALVESHRRQVATNIQLARYAASIEQLSISRERNRLARELHDTLAHSLSALTLQLEAVNALWEVDSTAARKMLARADETSRTGLTEARRSLQALRATPLEQYGLAFALREMAESAAQRADLDLELDVPELAINLPPHIEQALYRIAQEALENVVRHARAQKIRLQLHYSGAEIELRIADDGIGFMPEQVNPNGTHWGIAGMKERATMLGAELHIQSLPRRGTHLSLCLVWDGINAKSPIGVSV